MCKIQNVARADGLYYYRRLIRLGPDKPFRLRFSLRTTSRRRAALLAPALTLIAERLAMTMMASIAADGLTARQRAEIFRRQMLVERDRLEAMHANLHFLPRDDHQEAGRALSLRLGASEMAASDGVTRGAVDDFLVAHVDPDDDDADILIMAWSDIAASIAEESPEAAALARLAEIGVAETQLRASMARKVVNQARVAAIREFREALVTPERTYPPVPLESYSNTGPSFAPASSPVAAPAQPEVSGPWATMKPSEAAVQFLDANPRTGGKNGDRRRKGKAWTKKTRDQFELPALLLEQVMHGRPMASVTQEDLLKLDECFEKLHGPTFRKSDRQRAMTIFEIIAETDAKIAAGEKAAARDARRRSRIPVEGDGSRKRIKREDLGLGIATTNRHWGFLRQLTNWFGGKIELPELDYGAFIQEDERDPRDLQDTYSAEEGEFLFRLPPWTGAGSIAKRMTSGDLVIHDAWYWVPLIGWYTGMRRGEICGLRLEEVKCVDGDWLFVVQPNEQRRLKTSRSKRVLPMADELLRLGLPEYIGALEAAGETMLFPELRQASGKGDMGNTFYKNYWTKIAKKLPFLEPGQAVHAFRHTAIDEMKVGKISSEVRADFGGQTLSSQTEGRYSKAHIALIREGITAIPVVTKHLDPVPVTLLPAKLRAPRKARPQRPD